MFSPQKRNRLWTFLSLWSLLALTSPQLLMACPMSGEGLRSTPNATHCCSKKQQADSAMKGCCKKVPLPPSDTSGDDEKIALSKTRVAAFDAEHLIAPSTPAVISPLAFFEPQFVAIAFSPTTSPPLISQHTPTSHSGRAPPF